MLESNRGDTESASGSKRLLVFAPLVLFLLLVGTIFLPRLLRGTDASVVPSALIGKPVPSFALAPVAGLDRPGLATADLRTGEVTVLNVFASWCVPCRQEQGELVKLAGQGVRIVGIAYKDKPEATRRFLNQETDPFKAVGADLSGLTSIDFGVYGVPETYVVKGDGTIAYKIVGPLTGGNIERELLPALAAAKKG